MEKKWALSNSARYCTEVGAVEFWSTFSMVKKCALSCYSRHFTWYIIGPFRRLLDIINGKQVVVVKFCSIIHMAEDCELSGSARHFHGREVGAVEFCSTFNMVQKWNLSS